VDYDRAREVGTGDERRDKLDPLDSYYSVGEFPSQEKL
jgi:hypothetical protein